jgi:hypothetical protein
MKSSSLKRGWRGAAGSAALLFLMAAFWGERVRLAAGGESTPGAGEKESGRPVLDGDLSGWLEGRWKELQPSAREKAFDRIGWARDLRSAERLSRESGRPVFLFTHDGRINTGRC